MASVTMIKSKDGLMSLASQLSFCSTEFNGEIQGLIDNLSSAQNYEDINVTGAANVLITSLNNLSNMLNAVSTNVANYVSDVIEFDKYDLNIDDAVANGVVGGSNLGGVVPDVSGSETVEDTELVDKGTIGENDEEESDSVVDDNVTGETVTNDSESESQDDVELIDKETIDKETIDEEIYDDVNEEVSDESDTLNPSPNNGNDKKTDINEGYNTQNNNGYVDDNQDSVVVDDNDVVENDISDVNDNNNVVVDDTVDTNNNSNVVVDDNMSINKDNSINIDNSQNVNDVYTDKGIYEEVIEDEFIDTEIGNDTFIDENNSFDDSIDVDNDYEINNNVQNTENSNLASGILTGLGVTAAVGAGALGVASTVKRMKSNQEITDDDDKK